MAEFTVNATRFDPYKAFMFRVKWDGQYVAGVSKMSALKRSTDPVVHREGGDPTHERKSPGKTKYDAVTLERGVTHDPAFEEWANLVHSLENADLAEELPQGRHRRRLQRGRPEGDLVQAVPVLGLRVPGAARSSTRERPPSRSRRSSSSSRAGSATTAVTEPTEQ